MGEPSTIVDYWPGEVIETEKCTICAGVESPGFYTGCCIQDGQVTDWKCDGKGNLTRHDPEDEMAGWFIVELDSEGVAYDAIGPYDTEAEAKRVLSESGKAFEVA